MSKDMIKQILGKLPKKQSKSADTRDSLSSTSLAGSRSRDSATHKSGNGKDLYNQGLHLPSNSGLVHGNKSAQMEDSSENNNLFVNETLPCFRDVPSSEKLSLFIRKVQLCCCIFDFSDPLKNSKEKDIKRQTLLELVDYLTSATGKFPENTLQEIIRMVSINLFRVPNAQPRENKTSEAYDIDEDEPLMDPAWPHLQIVYEFFLRFVASPETETKLAKRYIDHSFILKLLDLFDSEDPRERDYLKTILHRIYGKFMVHRPFIRKSINNIFYRFIFETEKFNGIAELLEVLGSIINGFALPLKEEHKFFLVRILIPLHKPKCLAMYHQQLSYCISQFVEKDSKLSDTVIRGLLKYWPITNSSKEVMFLSELEEILEATQIPEFQRCMVALFHRIARCLSSSHFQVAERALYLWSNEHIENMIRQNRKVILPIIFSALEKNCRYHWSQAVRTLTVNVQKLFSDNDPVLFEECLRKFEEDKAKEQELKAKQEATWKHIEEIISSKTSNCEKALS